MGWVSIIIKEQVMLKNNLEEVIEKKIESFYDWVEKKTPSAQQKKNILRLKTYFTFKPSNF